jgi:hypothetical protein
MSHQRPALSIIVTFPIHPGQSAFMCREKIRPGKIRVDLQQSQRNSFVSKCTTEIAFVVARGPILRYVSKLISYTILYYGEDHFRVDVMARRERNKSRLLTRSVINVAYPRIKSLRLEQDFYVILVTSHDSRTRSAHCNAEITDRIHRFAPWIRTRELSLGRDRTWEERKRESEEERPFASITIPLRDRVVTEDRFAARAIHFEMKRTVRDRARLQYTQQENRSRNQCNVSSWDICVLL